MDFEAVVEELFAAKREEFTVLRDEHAKQARPDRPLADEITKLRKPTVAAWLVNQVSRAYPEEIDRLAELGESLRKAHQRLAGAELRTLSRQRHELIDMLAKRAQWLARKAGYPFSDATGRQIGETFEAAVSDPQALDAVRVARLSAALTPGAPEQWLTAAIMPVKSPPKAAAKKKPAVKEKTPPSKVDREQERRRAAREKARKEAEDSAKAQDEAEQALSEAERAADEAATTVAELRGRLEEATQAEHEKRADVTAARKTVTAARRTAKAAERRATDLD
jgi:hypothetical protein